MKSVYSVGLFFCFIGSVSASKINTNFLYGVKSIPGFFLKNEQLVSGDYLVDFYINNESKGKVKLRINELEAKSGELCFSLNWLNTNAHDIDLTRFVPNKDMCYKLTENEYVKVDFSMKNQSLNISMPEVYIRSIDVISSNLDYGSNGVRLDYSGNINRSTAGELSSFANFNPMVNLGEWILRANMNIQNSEDQNKFSSSNLYLKKVIEELKSDLYIGQSSTMHSELFSNVSFVGASIRSNSLIDSSYDNSYAPVITGIADGPSRITIEQSNFVIYSKTLPAGPYDIKDLTLSNNSDLKVTVENDNGKKKITFYPITTLPTLLRPGTRRFDITVGNKNDQTEISSILKKENGLFSSVNYDYGFEFATLNAAGILHKNYNSAGVGVTKNLGRFGALSSSALYSNAKYKNTTNKTGNAFSLKYAKNLGPKTDLQLMAYRHQSENFVEFANFQEKSYDDGFNSGLKNRYEARVYHRMDKINLSASFWQQNYWATKNEVNGASVSLGFISFDQIPVQFGMSHNSYAGKKENSYSLSFSIPFTLGGKRNYTSTSLSYDRDGNTAINTSMSSSINDRLNYSLALTSGLNDISNTSNLNGTMNYLSDKLRTSANLYSSPGGTFGGGVAIAGSAFYTPQIGTVLTNNTSSTLGIVKIKNLKGVKLNYSSLPSDENGNSYFGLSGFTDNMIQVDASTIPDDVDLSKLSFRVKPSEGAIIYREIDALRIQSYIIKVFNRNGELLTGGDVYNTKGVHSGFISNDGILLIRSKTKIPTYNVNVSDNGSCKFSVDSLKPNLNKVQEVFCD